MNQPIPSPPNIDDKLHSIDLRGQTEHDWDVKMLPFIHEWNIRDRRVVNAPLLMEPLHHRSEYMQWYTRHTRRWISTMVLLLGQRLVLVMCPRADVFL